jgi:hypothetical protein
MVTGVQLQLALLVGLFLGAPQQGPAPADIVVLQSRTPQLGACPAGTRRLASRLGDDGTTAGFTIPEGHALVVTSAVWKGTGQPQRIYNLSVMIVGDAAQSELVGGGGTVSDADGNISGAVQFSPGFVAKHGTTLCAALKKSVSNPTSASNQWVKLYGVLTKYK